jgi:hypothetical protein
MMLVTIGRFQNRSLKFSLADGLRDGGKKRNAAQAIYLLRQLLDVGDELADLDSVHVLFPTGCQANLRLAMATGCCSRNYKRRIMTLRNQSWPVARFEPQNGTHGFVSVLRCEPTSQKSGDRFSCRWVTRDPSSHRAGAGVGGFAYT